MSIAGQFALRLEGLTQAVRQLPGSFSPDDAAPTPHLRVLAKQAELLLENARAAADLNERMRVVVRVEELLRFAQQLRDDYATSDANVLLVASYVASECYKLVVETGLQLGAKPLLERWPEPAVLLEPMQSPVTFVRDSGVRTRGFTGRSATLLPFPLVLMPPYPLAAMSALCFIHHEIGHNVDQDLGLSAALQPELEDRLEAAHVLPELVGTWLDWTREVVADAFGTMLAGPAFAVEMASWAEALSDDGAPASRTHPFPSLRVKLAEEVLRALGLPESRHRAKVSAPPSSSSVARYLTQVPVVARALLEAPIQSLEGASILDLAPDVASDADLVEAAAKELGSGSAAEAEKLPLRLFPSAACLASHVYGKDPGVVAELLLEAALKQDRGPTAVPFSEERYRATTLRAAVPPILDEERDGLKLPPPGLFRDARSVSFVGATNDGLPALFAKYDGQRKQRVEIFFLSLDALKGLDGGGRDLAKLLELGRKARSDLTPGMLNRLAEQWVIYEYDRPFLFASYWDADAPGGRIHISAHAWGQDIKRAPSHDYTWPIGAPRPERSYRFYRDALNALRGRASTISASAWLPRGATDLA